MASNGTGLDPPTRLGPVRSESRSNTYWQPTLEKQRARRIELSGQVGQTESSRGYAAPRSQQTGLPRPSVRSPSPSIRTTTESQTGSQRFGFGKTSSKPPTQSGQPDLKPKGSRNVLRRKQSSIAQHINAPRPSLDRAESASPSKWSQASENRPSIDASLKSVEAYNEIFARTRAKTPVPNEPQFYPELDRYRIKPDHAGESGLSDLPPKLATNDLPPPTPLLTGTPLYSGSISSHHRYSGAYSISGYSASPSTRFSESPGPGAFSRNTTPTSISSQSPGLVVPVKPMTPRLRQGSPAQTRPPVTRRRTGSNANETDIAAAIDIQGLPSLRESGLSSSSNSTGKDEHKTPDSKKKKKRLSPLPPSPPPRKSSQKFKKSPSSRPEESPTKASSTPAKPVMTSPTQAPPVMKLLAPSKIPGKSVPPARPSRDGAPDLQPQLGDSIAIIQSNLASIPFSVEKKRQSGIARASPQIPQLAPRSAQSSRLPSRNPSPSPVQPSHREATPAPAGLGIIPDLKPQAPAKGSGLRTPSPSLSSHKHRFGLFGRRTKTAPEAIPTEKSVRKGPAAGTGHEGYGRYAPRGRSISTGSVLSGRERSISAASSSMESVSSTRTHDPFLLERMSPVIIAGGEIIENQNTSSELARTESNTSLPMGRPSVESRGSAKTSTSKESPRMGLWPSAMPKDASKRTSTLAVPKGRRPSDSSDDGLGASSLAFRRSIGRFNDPNSALQLPKPLNTKATGSSTTSLIPSILSDDSQLSVADKGRDRHLQIKKSKKLEKRPKSPKRWNIFHRSQPKPQPEPELEPEPLVPVTVGRQPIKAVPHYALMDSSDELPDYLEGVDLEELENDCDVVDLSDAELDRLQFGEMQAKLKREKQEKEKKVKEAKAKEEKLPTLLFASQETATIAPEPSNAASQAAKEDTQGRPSRLPQVGRIPKVVTARPQATSPKSFSRPFARLSVNQPLLEPIIVDKESVALGPSPPKPAAMFPQTNIQAEIEAVEESRRGLEERSESLEATPADFLAFSPRKGSVVTTSSSGNISFSEVTTAVIPQPGAALAEDEIWDEYDDLIENDGTTKDKVPLSATSSHGVPFQYESYESRRLQKSITQPKESPTLVDMPKPKALLTVDTAPPRASILTASSVYSQDMSPKLKDALAAIATPTTPMSFSEFISGYGDRNNSVQGDSAKKPRRSSRSSSRKSNSDSVQNQSQSGLLPITEQPTPVEAPSPVSQVNLRLGSMTVSKWLTFGHVLFSPARDSIKAAENDPSKRHSVLVIDGLGNDDWSFYAADIYPTATFYNLSPTRPLSASQRAHSSSSFPHTPPNHRQVQYLSPSLKFPFPSSTFHVVVFRFPPSLPLANYQNVVNEAKRVLLPGGYLEMAILDVDMMNMGPRARRAVRSLKTAMQSKEGQSVWTGSASDTVLKCIGKRGFESVKTCVVGVPVATPVSSSDAKGKSLEVQRQEDKSLAELIKAPHTTAADENITSMVAKVGRWWYSRCYESMSIEEGRPSMFDDKLLLAEGEEWQSSFKLVVLHARKPIAGGIRGGGRRRTLSV